LSSPTRSEHGSGKTLGVGAGIASQLSVLDLGTLAGLHQHQRTLTAYCPICERWAVLPLADLIAQGKGSLRLPIRVRCRYCGEVGRPQVRPPVPTRGSAVGWISPS